MTAKWPRLRRLAGALAALALAAAAGGPGAAGAATPVAPWVHVAGVRFVDSAGRPVILRGVNQQAGAGAGSNANAAELGVNLVRVVAPWSMIEPTAPNGDAHTYNAAKLAALDAQVEWYRAHGINVLLDSHQFKWSPYFDASSQGIPAWFYSVTEAGRYPADADGMRRAMADWWTDPTGRAAYIGYVRMMESRYAAYPNVIGYEVFNEPQVGTLGEDHASAQAVVTWEAAVVRAMRAADPARAIFFMLRGGGDTGLLHADLSPFGADLHSMVLDMHDYYNGLYGSGFAPDQETWAPSWEATHNQASLAYHGTRTALERNLQVAIARTRRLGIPLFIGEWGVQTADSGAAAFQSQMLEVLRRFGLSWARWDVGRTSAFGVVNRDGSLNAMGLGIRSALGTPAATAGIAPAADLRPALVGFAQVSQRLTADPGLWAGVPAPALRYRWQRCSARGTHCVTVAGRTAATYRLTSADRGASVRALVTGTSSAGDRTVATPLSPRVSAYGLALAQVAVAKTAAAPTVTVSWSQSLPATVQIVIEDASGTVVKHLLRSADYAAGSWFVRWARYGDGGAVVPSGSYRVVVTATAGGVSVTTAAGLAL